MSWFADLAGKAEDLLNRVDQGAATALSRKENTSNIIYSKNTDYPELHQQNTDLTYTEPKDNYISSAADKIKNKKKHHLSWHHKCESRTKDINGGFTSC